MKKLTLVALGLALAPATALAADYGVAGCGLGSLVFEPGSMQTSAVTTNNATYSQTFGITSGTSNCVDGAEAAGLDQEVFLRANYASVMQDAAVGSGQYLEAFAMVLGCEVKSHPAFYDLAQKNHERLFTADGQPESVLAGVKQAMHADQALAASCARI